MIQEVQVSNRTELNLSVNNTYFSKSGFPMSAAVVMENMHRLHSCLLWRNKKKMPEWMIEEPTERQTRILKTFGYAVATGGVLQKVA